MSQRALAAALAVLKGAGGAADADAALLGRFAACRDEGAFAEMVRRHGAMVLGVCRRVLRSDADADDAFQATFLLMALRAGGLAHVTSVAGWLHGAARRTALNARKALMRRRKHEAAALHASPPVLAPAADLSDLQAALDEELTRLPEEYRAAFVLCCLEGLTRPEAAAALGCAEGTVSSRLARARGLLQERLPRRGITLAAAITATSLARGAAVTPVLAASTARLACLLAAAGGLTDAVPAAVAALLQGATLMTVKKTALLAALALAALAAGAAAVAGLAPPAAPPPAANLAPAAPAAPPAPLTAAQLSGVWRGEKDGVTATVAFRGRAYDGDDARWRVVVESDARSAAIGAGLRARDGGEAGTVFLDFRGAAIGRVERGGGGGLLLSVLPAAAEAGRDYRAVERIPLAFVEDEPRRLQGAWRVVEVRRTGAPPAEGGAAVVSITPDRIALPGDEAGSPYDVEWWPLWDSRKGPGLAPREISVRSGGRDLGGIYELAGGRLRLLLVAGAGKGVKLAGFDVAASAAGESRTLYTLVREAGPVEAKGVVGTAAGAPAWGEAVAGIRLGIAAAGPGRAAVTLENVGEADAVVNLGLALGNGRRHLPTALRLTATDADGKAHALTLKEPGVAGRVDPYLVPLPAGCSFTMPVALKDFAGGPLAPGTYRVRASLRGEAVTRTNADMAGLVTMKYWAGAAASGDAKIDPPAGADAPPAKSEK